MQAGTGFTYTRPGPARLPLGSSGVPRLSGACLENGDASNRPRTDPAHAIRAFAVSLTLTGFLLAAART